MVVRQKHLYPNVAKCAQLWLSVPATSTPSKRVFSICSVVDTARRNGLKGRSIENQVFIHYNKDYVLLY